MTGDVRGRVASLAALASRLAASGWGALRALRAWGTWGAWGAELARLAGQAALLGGLLGGLLTSVVACRSREEAGGPVGDAGAPSEAGDEGGAAGEAVDESASARALAPSAPAPTPPKGMVWIPPGILLAGTPEGRLPRVADAEMPGSQVVMRGFFIDELPYPNEAGGIPITNVTQPQAADLCEQQGKRLCTELEWERACKGPNNTTYPYGDTYRAAECGTGVLRPAVPPTGVLAGCKSGFGVRDLHGGVWQWTASPWGRATVGNQVTLRGGNASAGEVVGRCANAAPRRPSDAQPNTGFRCCAGDRNLAEVTINIVRGEALRLIGNDTALMASLEHDPPAELARLLDGKASFKVLQTWRWHPIGNEELILQSGCANPDDHALCGIAVGRPRLAQGKRSLQQLGFASSGWWLPALHEDLDPRELWVFGGDKDGGYRRRLGYAWGSIAVGQPERNIKKKRKRREN
jgi:formylglycine-generating enzyme